MSSKKYASRKFTEPEKQDAIDIVQKVRTARELVAGQPDLPIYTAYAIDKGSSVVRDDAINFIETDDAVTLEVFISDPTRFISQDGITEEGAKERKASLYRGKRMVSPMLHGSLSDGVFSLDERQLSPAWRIAIKHNRTGQLESIVYERCWVKPQNVTFEEVSSKIQQKEEPFISMSRMANWLQEIRTKNAVFPDYDPESGIILGEDGETQYVDPRLINSHKMVIEAMLWVGHAKALFMEKCFDYGIFKEQKTITSETRLTDTPAKNTSVGFLYTPGGSTLRSYADMLVDRFLEQGGDRFELRFDGSAHPKLEAPLSRKELKNRLNQLNVFNAEEKETEKKIRRERAVKLLEKVFPDTIPEKLGKFEPPEFSSLLEAAFRNKQMNNVFAEEIKLRIHNKGGAAGKLGLLIPQDAITILRYAKPKTNRNNPLWNEIVTALLEDLAAHPQKLELVFDAFMQEIYKGEYEIRKASFTAQASQRPDEPRYPLVAAAVIASKADGISYTTREFAIGSGDKTSETRAKLEFLKGYVSYTLKKGDPELPNNSDVYIAKELHIEQANKIRQELLKAGYELREFPIEQVSTAEGSSTNYEYKYSLEIIKDGNSVISVTTQKEDATEAQKIGLEAAILNLRSREHPEIGETSEYTGLGTFTGKLSQRAKARNNIKYGSPLLVSPQGTTVIDLVAYRELLEILADERCKIKRYGENETGIKITTRNKNSQEAVKAKILAMLPNAVVLTTSRAVMIETAPAMMLQLCAEPSVQR